ncbi:hypothetical protein LV82_02558 [Albidovulum inexpectatum]|uniref:Uncharacterized protein n=1 Tax=Albidovulum inexpectatum TaxID=196587 RepID=A0A2S5JE61_9RHOB|nr:hypothetical protein [Albidovulum inexpectatum]PPB79767.1 hypothetical protein LV82_02558 [Albidovulum inexpectatum]
MQVKLIQPLQSGTQIINAGCVIDLPDAKAKALVSDGRAVEVKEAGDKAKPEKAKPSGK